MCGNEIPWSPISSFVLNTRIIKVINTSLILSFFRYYIFGLLLVVIATILVYRL